MIEVTDVYKTFFVPHKVKALVGVSTQIAAGEVVVVIGPSGSGKSTFLRCLNHLEAADSGHILIDGIDILAQKTDINKIRAEVGMVFQSFNLFPHKSVIQNVTLAQKVVRKRSGRASTERARTLLEKVGISDKANAYPDNLSGRQQQRGLKQKRNRDQNEFGASHGDFILVARLNCMASELQYYLVNLNIQP